MVNNWLIHWTSSRSALARDACYSEEGVKYVQSQQAEPGVLCARRDFMSKICGFCGCMIESMQHVLQSSQFCDMTRSLQNREIGIFSMTRNERCMSKTSLLMRPMSATSSLASI